MEKLTNEQIWGVPSNILRAIFNELKRAENKFPDWPTDMIHAAAIVSEESGELIQSALRGDIIEAEKEAIQVVVTSIRFLKGTQKLHYQPNNTFKSI